MCARRQVLTVAAVSLAMLSILGLLCEGNCDGADPSGVELKGKWTRPEVPDAAAMRKQPLIELKVDATGHFTALWDGRKEEGDLKITSDANPKQLLMKITKGIYKNSTRAGIYKLEQAGDKTRLTVCLAKPGAEGPTTFVRDPGVFELWTLER